MYDTAKFPDHLNTLSRIEVAYEHGILKPVSKAFHHFEHSSEAKRIRDVVRNQITSARGCRWITSSSRGKGCVLFKLADQVRGKDPRLDFKGTTVAGGISEDGMAHLNLKASLVCREHSSPPF